MELTHSMRLAFPSDFIWLSLKPQRVDMVLLKGHGRRLWGRQSRADKMNLTTSKESLELESLTRLTQMSFKAVLFLIPAKHHKLGPESVMFWMRSSC